MILLYTLTEDSPLQQIAFDPQHPAQLQQALWIDCLSITDEEEAFIEKCLALALPTQEEMREIEISSRLYKENNYLYMTANVIASSLSDAPKSDAITFILTQDKIITLRYIEPRPFNVFALRASQSKNSYRSSSAILIGLLETIVDRAADILEEISDRSDMISEKLFNPHRVPKMESNLQETLYEIGRNNDLIAKTHQSLASIHRMVKFFKHHFTPADQLHLQSDILDSDIMSLSEYSNFLSNKLSFQLDVTLGRINGEQNDIIKIFSVVTVIFLPPTLISSMYGMNFHLMPELGWKYGYVWALLLMVTSAVVPILYFKKRKWL
jgi:magnesium transporter